MALSNAQYDSILHTYEQRRLFTRHQLDERTKEIYRRIPKYKELDEQIATTSVTQGKKHIMGDENALADLTDILEDLNRQKKLLLTEAGYSVSYLDPVYHCSFCKDTGYISNAEKCHCFKQAILDLLYEQSNIHEVLKIENFDTLSFDYYDGDDLQRYTNAVNKAKEFVENFDSAFHNLYFYGTVGTGKSFLSNCIANSLIKSGHSVIYFSSSALFERISAYTFQKGGKDQSSPFDDIYNCDLLIIDDLGTELTNSFVTTQLFSCLNERNLRHKATVISTNLSLEDLRERYSDRIFSRITSTYELFKLSGQDIRLFKKRLQNRK